MILHYTFTHHLAANHYRKTTLKYEQRECDASHIMQRELIIDSTEIEHCQSVEFKDD